MAQGGLCTDTDELGFSNCMKWKNYNGKIYFLASDYHYTRSRAIDVCNSLGAHLAVPQSELEHQNVKEFLYEHIGDPNAIANSPALDEFAMEYSAWIGPELNRICSFEQFNQRIGQKFFGKITIYRIMNLRFALKPK